MAPRPTWSGQLKISLVSFPIRLYPASNPGRSIELHQLHKTTGKRIRYQTVVPDEGPVSRDEIIKGYEYKRGKYVTLEPEELEEVRLPTRHTLEMVQFVDAHEIDPLYYEKPYFVVPEDAAANEAFAVVRDALRAEKKIGLGEVVFSGKEHLVAIRPCGKGMLLETLRYTEEVRKSDAYFGDIEKVKVDDDQVALAKELIGRKTAPFDPDKFQDSYMAALKELIHAKVEGEDLPEDEEPKANNVINLMDALKKSVAESGKAKISPHTHEKKNKPAKAKKDAPKKRKTG
jgi:DNA end-binding protein Ku